MAPSSNVSECRSIDSAHEWTVAMSELPWVCPRCFVSVGPPHMSQEMAMGALERHGCGQPRRQRSRTRVPAANSPAGSPAHMCPFCGVSVSAARLPTHIKVRCPKRPRSSETPVSPNAPSAPSRSPVRASQEPRPAQAAPCVHGIQPRFCAACLNARLLPPRRERMVQPPRPKKAAPAKSTLLKKKPNSPAVIGRPKKSPATKWELPRGEAADDAALPPWRRTRRTPIVIYRGGLPSLGRRR